MSDTTAIILVTAAVLLITFLAVWLSSGRSRPPLPERKSGSFDVELSAVTVGVIASATASALAPTLAATLATAEEARAAAMTAALAAALQAGENDFFGPGNEKAKLAWGRARQMLQKAEGCLGARDWIAAQEFAKLGQELLKVAYLKAHSPLT